MKSTRILSLVLAGVLQIMPMLRMALPAQFFSTSTWAIVLKLGAGTVAFLGSHHAVSAATATTLIPAAGTYTLTAGIATNLNLSYFITGNHVPSSWSSAPSPVCPGMFVNSISGPTTVSGVPTTVGSFVSTITCWENNNFSGRSASGTYTYNVIAGPPPPVITNLVLSASPPLAPGTAVTLTPTLGGTGPFSYRWYFNNAPIFGGTNATLTLSSVQATNGGTYKLIVQNTTSGIATNSTNLVINSAPGFTAQPLDQYVAAGGTAVFSVAAGGATPFTYQWRKNGTNLAGATGATLTVAGVQKPSAGVYSVVVSNALGTVTSSNASLRVNASVGQTSVPLLALNASWRYNALGFNQGNLWREFDYNDAGWSVGNGILAVETANPTVVPNIGTTLAINSGGHYVTNFYFRTHFNITNRTLLSSLILSNVIDDGAVFYLNGTEVSRFNMPAGPIFSTTWASANLAEGVYNNLVVPTNLVVQGDNVLAVEVHQISATSSDIVMGLALFGIYNNPVTFPFITTQPVGSAVSPGANVTLTSGADASGPVTFQWLKDGSPVLGQSGPSLAFPTAQAADSGNFAFVASNSSGSVTSQVATLLVGAGAPPVVQTNLADQIAPVGTNVTLAVTVSGAGVAYRWFFNSNLVANAAARTLILTNANAGHSGFYSVTASNGAGSVSSRTAQLLVVPALGPGVAPVIKQSFSPGQFGLGFTTVPGYKYFIDYSAGLETTNWIALTNFPATFNPVSVNVLQNTTLTPQRFYRTRVTR